MWAVSMRSYNQELSYLFIIIIYSFFHNVVSLFTCAEGPGNGSGVFSPCCAKSPLLDIGTG